MSDIRRDIKATLETRDSYAQAVRESAALRGELGINAQLLAMSEVAKGIRASGDEAGYQAIKAEAYRLHARAQRGPVEAAVEGALERLIDEHSAAVRLAVAAGDKQHATEERRQTTAFSNALIEYRRGVRPELLPSGAWLLPSRRPGEAAHVVTMDGDWTCCCKAGASMHWPIALVIACEVAGDMMQDSDDGAPESELDAAKERTARWLDAERARQSLVSRLCAARGASRWAA